jgi:hypothetical protein
MNSPRVFTCGVTKAALLVSILVLKVQTEMKDTFQTFTYQIRVRGQIPTAWKDVFSSLDLTQEDDAGGTVTSLRGNFADLSALQGVLSNLCMLGLVLISVDCEEENPATNIKEA